MACHVCSRSRQSCFPALGIPASAQGRFVDRASNSDHLRSSKRTHESSSRLNADARQRLLMVAGGGNPRLNRATSSGCALPSDAERRDRAFSLPAWRRQLPPVLGRPGRNRVPGRDLSSNDTPMQIHSGHPVPKVANASYAFHQSPFASTGTRPTPWRVSMTAAISQSLFVLSRTLDTSVRWPRQSPCHLSPGRFL